MQTRTLPRIVAVANQKGGVGKTTTAINLGACLAELGFRVLVVDLDPQGNASTGLGINIRDLHLSMYDVLLSDARMEDCVEATSIRNLFVAPSSLDLAGAEIELVSVMSREQRLGNAIGQVRLDYDYVLIDCPPSLGLLTVNGLAAASEVLVPIQCEYYALEGLGQLLRNVELVQRNLNPTLEVSTIVLVMYDGRTTLARDVAQEVRSHFGEKVARTMVPRSVRLSEAPSFGLPITSFDPKSQGAMAYRSLAAEVAGVDEDHPVDPPQPSVDPPQPTVDPPRVDRPDEVYRPADPYPPPPSVDPPRVDRPDEVYRPADPYPPPPSVDPPRVDRPDEVYRPADPYPPPPPPPPPPAVDRPMTWGV